MPPRRRCLMLFMVVAIGSGLVIYQTTDEKTFQYKDDPHKLPLRPNSAFEARSKKKLQSLERSLTETRGLVFASEIQKESENLTRELGSEPSRKRFRRHSRKKRNVVQDPNGWFFNLNVTRPGGTMSLSNNPRFGISVHVEGSADSDELQVAWDHVQTLVHNLFGGGYEELSKSGHEIVIDLSGLPDSAQTELKEKEHLEEIQPPKGKEPKFFFGLLGVGGNRPTTEKVKDVVLEVPSSTPSETVVPHVEYVETASSIDEESTEGIPSPTEASLLEVSPIANDPIQPISTEPTVRPLVEHVGTFPVGNGVSTTPRSNFSNGLTVFPHVEYVETASSIGEESSAGKDENSGLVSILELTTAVATEAHKETQSEVPLENVNLDESSSTESSVLETTSNSAINLENNFKDPGLLSGTPFSTESFFSAGVSVSPEQLREFCVSILEKIQKSSRSGQLNFESIGNSSAEETAEANVTTEASKPENSGFFASLLNRIVGRNAAKTPEVTSSSKRAKTDDQRNSFFTKLDWNSGRGRSVELELNNMNETEFEDFNVTVSDCEIFFQDWLNMDQDGTTTDPLNPTSMKVDVINLEEPNEIENQTKSFLNENVESPVLENSGENSFSGNTGSGSFFDEVTKSSVLENAGGNSSSGVIVRNISENSFDEDLKSSVHENAGGNGSSDIPQRSLSETTTVRVEALDLIEVTSDRQITSEMEEKDARIFGLFGGFDTGSGGREIPVDKNDEFAENPSTTVSALSDLDIKEKKIATEDFSNEDLEVSTEMEGRRFIGFLNLGSGERQLGEESDYSDDYLFTLKTGMGTNDTNGMAMSSTEMARDYSTEDDTNHGRFILNIGSGDGRDLADTDDDSGLDIILPECVSCFLDNRTGEVNCSECTTEEIALKKYEDSTAEYGEGEELDPDKRFFLSGTRDSTEEIIMKDHDDTDSNTTTMLPLLLPRGSRDHDEPFPAWDDNEFESDGDFAETRPVHKDPSPLIGRRGRSEDLEEPFVANVVTSPNFKVGVDPISVEIVRIVRPSSKPKIIFNQSFVEYFETTEQTSTEDVITTTNEDVITTTGGQRLTRSNRCNDDDDCFSELNEVCVEQERQSICGCGDGLVRSPKTRICSKRVVLEMTMRIPLEFYHPDMNDSSSKIYENTKTEFIISVNIILGDLKILQDELVDIEIKRFEPGSLIVHANLVFAKPKELSSVNMVMNVLETFKKGVQDRKFLKALPLRMRKSEVMAIFVAGDVCDRIGNFKCHENAKCIPDKNGGFTCKCKRGFVDLNLNGAPGRECEACPVEFCNGNGICQISHEGTKYCQCTGWNVGSRCEIPGTVVIGGVAAFNGLFVVIVVVLICFFRRRKSRSTGQYSGGEEGFRGTPSSAVPSRLRETVAMRELGQSVVGSKYASKSTPLQHQCPDIRIISPSNVGSDQSSVFDSTFDRSTCEQEDSKEKI